MKHLKKHPLNDKAQKLSRIKKENNTKKSKARKMSAEKDLATKPKMGRIGSDPSNKKLDGENFLAESYPDAKMTHKSKLEEMPLLIRTHIKKLTNLLKTSSVSVDDVIEAIKEELDEINKPKEPVTFTSLTTEEKEKMMLDALKMSEDQWMNKYKIGDHGDYLRMAKSKWNVG